MSSPRNAAIPLFAWPLAIAGGIAVAAAIVGGCAGDAMIAVPKRELPPFHRIVTKDLTTKKLSERDVSDGTLRKSSQLVGRVTRETIPRNQPVGAGTVTAKVSVARYRGLVPVAFSSAADSVADYKPGTPIRLLFAPTGDDRTLTALVTDALLISSKKATGGRTRYLVGVTPGARMRLLERVARAQLLVVPH